MNTISIMKKRLLKKISNQLPEKLTPEYEKTLLSTYDEFNKQVEIWNDKFGDVLDISPVWTSQQEYDFYIAERNKMPSQKRTLGDWIVDMVDSFHEFWYRLGIHTGSGKALDQIKEKAESL